MSDGDQSRRSFIKQAGAVPIAGVFTTGDSQSVIDSVDLSHLLIRGDHVDEEFTKFDADSPIPDRLGEQESTFEASSAAQRCYVKGEDPENPHWVVCSAAVRTPEHYNRDVIIDAETSVYDEYVRQYDRETPVEVNFEQDRTSHEDYTDWSYRMTRTVQIGDQRPLTYNLFKERYRIQFFERTLLMMLVFGPSTFITPSVDEMVDELAAFQREQHLETQ